MWRIDEVQTFFSEREFSVSGDGLNVGSEGGREAVALRMLPPASVLHNGMGGYISP